MIARVRRDGTGFLGEDMVPKLLAATSIETMPDVVRQVSAMVTGSPPDGVAGALAAMRDRPDAHDLLPRITVPTLVVAGSGDQLIPLAESRAMASAIPDAHFAVIPSAGHLASLEQPVNTSRVIREFLESLL
jgi:3-oxoadipate enol-lactonase